MKVLKFLVLLTITSVFSQKQYSFNYMLEYELIFKKRDIKEKDSEKYKKIHKYYLINSKNNDYVIEIIAKDSLYNKLVLRDNNGLFSQVFINKSDFKNTKFLTIDCKFVKPYIQTPKRSEKYYDFFILNDTIINGKEYAMYKYNCIKPKRVRRNKIGELFYIINKSKEFNFLILDINLSNNKKRKMPNGIIKESFWIDYYGKLVKKEKLIRYRKINKTILISNDCDFTDPKFFKK